MDLTTVNGKINTLFAQLVIDLVAVCNYGSGEII